VAHHPRPTHSIGFIFGLVLLYSAYSSLRQYHEDLTQKPDPLALRLKTQRQLPRQPRRPAGIRRQRVPAGFGLMTLAGTLSGLLGIGSGAVKVIAMDQAMRLPFKVSTTTSNFMIGVTAAASAGTLTPALAISPRLVMPVMLGVLVGSLIGSRLLVRVHVRTLKIVFALVNRPCSASK